MMNGQIVNDRMHPLSMDVASMYVALEVVCRQLEIAIVNLDIDDHLVQVNR